MPVSSSGRSCAGRQVADPQRVDLAALVVDRVREQACRPGSARRPRARGSRGPRRARSRPAARRPARPSRPAGVRARRTAAPARTPGPVLPAAREPRGGEVLVRQRGGELGGDGLPQVAQVRGPLVAPGVLGREVGQQVRVVGAPHPGVVVDDLLAVQDPGRAAGGGRSAAGGSAGTGSTVAPAQELLTRDSAERVTNGSVPIMMRPRRKPLPRAFGGAISAA